MLSALREWNCHTERGVTRFRGFQCKCEDVSTKADKTELFQDEEEKFCFLCQNIRHVRQCVYII
jgi:hypothetical protein